MIFYNCIAHYYDNHRQGSADHSLISLFENQAVWCQCSCVSTCAFSADNWKAMTAKEKESILMNYRLAFRKVGHVNWCEALGTVLANDEVKDGLSERGGFPVIQKEMMQWSLRVTAYAERLLTGMDTIQWSESLKTIQRNWIGRSEGDYDFKFADESGKFVKFLHKTCYNIGDVSCVDAVMSW